MKQILLLNNNSKEKNIEVIELIDRFFKSKYKSLLIIRLKAIGYY